MTQLSDRLRYINAPRHAQVIAFVLMLLGAIAAIGFFLTAQSASVWVRHTLAVEWRLATVQTAVARAESLRRGVALGGEATERADALRASQAARTAVAALARDVSDNPEQRRHVARLAALLRDRAAQAAAEMGAAPKVETAVDRAAMAAIDRAAATVAATERALLAQRTARAERLERLGIALLLASSIALLVLTLLVWHDRRQRMAALHQMNRDLATDVTLRRQIEMQLEMLASNASDAVLRIAPDGTCLYASPSTREVLGIGGVGLVGRRIPALVDGDDRAGVVAGLSRLVHGESGSERVTVRPRRILTPAARPRWFEATARAAIDPATGDTREIVAAVRDVTIRKALELELQDARVRAEEAAATKAAFLANMSHEIRTPMNGVIGFTDLVLDGELSAVQRRRVERIADSGRSMMRLLNDILDLSKIEAGAMRIADDDVDLRRVLDDCTGLMEPVARQKGLTLEANVAPSVPALLAGDPLRVRQILLNLIGNAVKFTVAGSVAILAEMVDGRVRVAVGDTGIGIAHDRLARIFDQFEQADDRTAHRFGGSGLGLAISARLATMMGGGITAESVEGEGSVFVLDLPATPRAPSHAANGAVPLAAPAAPAPALRVLLAEDHDINQELATAMLARLGIVPQIVEDGAEAVAAVLSAAARGTPFDVVLMDVRMPEVDGLEATRRLRAAGFGADVLPIVALTAHAFDEDVRACLDAGMQAHLTKPVQLAELSDTIARVTTAPVAVPDASAGIVTADLAARYRARRAELLHLLERIAAGDRLDPDAAREAADLLHKLAGAAGMFGDPATGEWAAQLERQLPQLTGRNDVAAIRRALDALAIAA